MRILNVVNQHGLEHSRLAEDTARYYPDDWLVSTLTMKDVKEWKEDLTQYDVIFMWPWISKTGKAMRTDTIPHQLHDRTVFMVTSEEAYDHVLNTTLSDTVEYIGVINGSNASSITEKHGVHTFILEPGIDLNKFKPSPIPEDFTVGWVGRRTDPTKRWPWADQARHIAKVPIKHLPINVQPTAEFYDSISVLLITSEKENLTPHYYEALASGRPVISTLVGDIPLTARDGKNGFYLPPYGVDSPDFAELINILKTNRDRLETMGAEAAKDVAMIGWKNRIEAYVDAAIRVKGSPEPEAEITTIVNVEPLEVVVVTEPAIEEEPENVIMIMRIPDPEPEPKPKRRTRKKKTTR